MYLQLFKLGEGTNLSFKTAVRLLLLNGHPMMRWRLTGKGRSEPLIFG